MSFGRVMLLTMLAMIAFSGNSLLCRLALKNTAIDPASFTAVRLISGAVALWLILQVRQKATRSGGHWASATALFAYAAGFSLAYTELTAGMGALLLFGAVQATMILYGLWKGERINLQQSTGLVLACAGLVGLMLPGLSAPPRQGSVLMLGAGIAWGIYSLRGRGIADPLAATAGNFLRTIPMALGLSLVMLPRFSLDGSGILLAIASGALASGLGYAIWYTALAGLTATAAATVQLSVPAIAALGGVVLIGEPLTLRLLITSMAILGGIAMVIMGRRTSSR